MPRGSARALVLAALLVAAVSLPACGGGSGNTGQAQIEAAKKDAAAQQKLKDKQAELQRQLNELKKQREKSRSSASSKSSTGSASGPVTSPPSSASDCGGGVSAGANTSCAFALNVANAYFGAGGGSPTVSVYSPVTNRSYAMSCTGGAPTVCRGGTNAVVYVR